MLALCYVLAAVYTISINVYGVLLLKFQKTASEAEDEDERVSDGKLLLAALMIFLWYLLVSWNFGVLRVAAAALIPLLTA